MYKILICDDDANFAFTLNKKIRAVLDDLGKPAQIHTCNDVDDISRNLWVNCDIALLDIDFPGKDYTGIDIAKRLRKEQSNAIIIFTTDFPEYAPEGYEVQAFRYLLKDEVNTKLKRYLAESFLQLAKTKRKFQITIGKEVFNLPIDDILYLEAQLHTVVVYVSRGNCSSPETYSFYSTLTSLEEELSPLGFLRIHKSYLVNMKHLVSYMCNEAVISNGTILKVSEKNYAVQKKKYLFWKGRQ